MKHNVSDQPQSLSHLSHVGQWTTGEIISAGLGCLCCSMERVYAIMNHLTGAQLFTHQLPGAFRSCQQWVLKQHPWLLKLDQSKCTPATWQEWLKAAEAMVGTRHDLEPVPGGVEQREPLQELVEMCGADRVIAVGA